MFCWLLNLCFEGGYDGGCFVLDLGICGYVIYRLVGFFFVKVVEFLYEWGMDGIWEYICWFIWFVLFFFFLYLNKLLVF